MLKIISIIPSLFLAGNLFAANITFQVDMSLVSVSFNGVHIVGGFQGWDPASDELFSENDDGVYALTLELVSGETHEYKYINGNDWNGEEFGFGVNRLITVPDEDTVLDPVCFGDISGEPCEGFSTEGVLSSLTFNADLSNAAINNGFELGDTLYLKWGYAGTQSNVNTSMMTPEVLSFSYSVSFDSVNVNFDSGLFYQYYRLKNDAEFREIYFNFEYGNPNESIAERRFISFEGLSDGDELTIDDIVNSNVDSRRMPTFMNTDPIGQELTVTWTVDLRPAYYQVLSGSVLEDIQGSSDVTDADSVFAWGVWMNGPATEPAGESWTSWGSTLYNTEAKKMWDDGSHGDAVAGDSVYTVQFTYDPDASIGQEFKFGIRGGDNESGYGLNHIENIDIANPIVASFWGSINPLFYDAWDYDEYLAIEEIVGSLPHQFSLGDNFPNPFNPATTFEFTIPYGAEVRVSIYDLTGRLISTIHNQFTSPGKYQVSWNGNTGKGIPAGSGIYFYELNADPYYKQIKKMTLVK